MDGKTRIVSVPALDPATSSADPPLPDTPPRRKGRHRIAGVDLARGIALIGMIGAHTLNTTGVLGWAPSTWASVVQGRSSILFAVLAGVSVALMTGGTSPVSGGRLRDARTRLLVRAVLIFALGSVLTVISTYIAIILQVYAVLVVGVLPLLRWSVRRLGLLALVLCLVSPVVNLLAAYAVAWSSSPSAPGEVSLIFFGGDFPAVVWWAFTVLGLLVGRLDLSTVRVAARLLLVGAVLAGIGYTAGWATTQLAEARGWWPEEQLVTVDPPSLAGPAVGDEADPPAEADVAGGAPAPTGLGPDGRDDLSGQPCTVTDESISCGSPGGVVPQGGSQGPPSPEPVQLLGARPHSGTTFEMVGSAGVALAVLGLCLLVPRRARWAVSPVRAAGSVPLTIYTAHVVVMEIAADQVHHHGGALFAGQVLAALVFGSLWTRWRGQGPLEKAVAAVARRTVTGT